MEDGLARGRFVEFGEYRGNLYGTAQESILSIINSGQVCVLCPHYQVSDSRQAAGARGALGSDESVLDAGEVV